MSILSDISNARVLLYRNFYLDHLEEIRKNFEVRFNSLVDTKETANGYTFIIHLDDAIVEGFELSFNNSNSIYPIVNEVLGLVFRSNEEEINSIFLEEGSDTTIDDICDYFQLIYDVKILSNDNIQITI